MGHFARTKYNFFYSELRLTAYETLSLWNTIAKSSSNIHLFAETLIPVIINDSTPISVEINLSVSAELLLYDFI